MKDYERIESMIDTLTGKYNQMKNIIEEKNKEIEDKDMVSENMKKKIDELNDIIIKSVDDYNMEKTKYNDTLYE